MPSGPKNTKYFNRHSAEANARDTERETNAKAAQAAAKENAKWAETDPKELKKLEKQREEEQKALERAQRNAEKKEQLETEEKELSNKAPKKVTQRQLQKDLSKMLADYDKQQAAVRGSVVEEPNPMALPSGNPNKAKGIATPEEPSRTVQASGSAGEVLDALQSSGEATIDDRHIGKRAKVLYKAFFAENIDKVREEKPGMRRTQYNDAVWDLWCKSPQNPFVQRSERRDRDRLEQERKWMRGEGSSADDEEDEEGEEASPQ